MSKTTAEPGTDREPSRLDRALGGVARLGRAVSGIAWAALAAYRLGGLTVVAAPAILALIVIPEFAQHAAEIHLGMFESKAAFKALSADPARWAFGYAKVAGFVLAILATARFWQFRSVRRSLLVAPAALLRILFAIGLTLVAELPFDWIRNAGGSRAVDAAAGIASGLVQAGLLVYLVGALLEDRAMTLRRAFGERWPTALLMTVLAALAFAPAQALHMYHHVLALGQPQPVVWALMLSDSLWVGLFAALLGSALYVGYRAGPTWKGWTVDPAVIARR